MKSRVYIRHVLVWFEVVGQGGGRKQICRGGHSAPSDLRSPPVGPQSLREGVC